MAGLGGKKYPLSIVVGTVDKATAKFEAINKSITRLTAPVRRLNNRLEVLKKASGADAMAENFGAAKDALGGFLGPIKAVTGGLLAVVGAAGLGTHAVMEFVEAQDALGEGAKRVGLGVDEFASFTGAAKAFGNTQEAAVGFLDKFTMNTQKARLGTGELTGFLKLVSPALLRQVKGTKSTTEALSLMANAIAKVTDPAKRAALATAAFGGGGAKLVGLLEKGAEGLAEFQKGWLDLAGSQEESVRRAEEAGAALDALGAAFQGIKASIVSAAAPAIKAIGERVTAFLADNRERLAAWFEAFGEKLPGAIEEFGVKLSVVLGYLKKAFDFVGGFQGIGTIFASIVGVKMVYSLLLLGKAITALGFGGMKAGIVALFNPVGLFLVALAAFAAAVYSIVQNWEEFEYAGRVALEAIGELFSAVWAGIVEASDAVVEVLMGSWNEIAGFFTGIWDSIGAGFNAVVDQWAARIEGVVQLARGVTDFLGITDEEAGPAGGRATPVAGAVGRNLLGAAAVPIAGGDRTVTQNAAVRVEFSNLPPGARATADPSSSADLSLDTGYQMAIP